MTDPQPRGFARLVGRPWFWALGVGILFGLPLVRSLMMPKPVMPAVRGEVPAFSLTRETGAPFGANDLQGRVWIAARFNTDEKQAATHAMLDLERRMRKLADAFELVSVDASAGPVAPIADWARAHKTNPRRWAFLTGAPADVDKVISALHLDAQGAAQHAADTELVLIDTHLRIRGFYDVGPNDRDTMEQLIYDAALLVNNY